MIRKYRAGDAFKVRVQPEQQAEAATWAAEFERIPAFALVEKGNDGSAAGEESGNMGAAEYDASGNGGAAAGDGKPAGKAVGTETAAGYWRFSAFGLKAATLRQAGKRNVSRWSESTRGES